VHPVIITPFVQAVWTATQERTVNNYVNQIVLFVILVCALFVCRISIFITELANPYGSFVKAAQVLNTATNV